MFCSQCGKEVQEGQNFCPECGTPIRGSMRRTAERQIHIRKYRCPVCEGYDLDVSSRMTGASSSTSENTEGHSTTSTTITYRKVWLCKDCGSEFVDPDEQRRQVEGGKWIFKFLLLPVFASLIFAPLGILLWKKIDESAQMKLQEIDEFEQSILTSNEA